MVKIKRHGRSSIIENAAHITGFACFSFAFLPLIFNLHPGLAGLAIFFLCTIFYSFVTTGLLAVLKGQASAKLTAAMRIVTGIVALTLLYLAFGWVQDMLGVRCTGFFGVTESCVESARFTIYFLLFNPFVLIPAVLALSFMFVRGLQEANPTATKRRK